MANGSVSFFLNPDNELHEGPLAFLQGSVLKNSRELFEELQAISADETRFNARLKEQWAELSEFYGVSVFDHQKFLESTGILAPSPQN